MKGDELLEELSTTEIRVRSSPAPSLRCVVLNPIQLHATESSADVLYPTKSLKRICEFLESNDVDGKYRK